MARSMGPEQALVTALVLALALTAAAAAAKEGVRLRHPQCAKYNAWQVEAKRLLLAMQEPAPLGTNVSCSDDERECLASYLLPLSDGSCVRLGTPCRDPQHPKEECRMLASRAHWWSARRLLGECVCSPPCPERHLPMHVSLDQAARCVQAGHLLCACAPPAQLQIAPFGGYECVTICEGRCSIQDGIHCTFPPLQVENSGVLYPGTMFTMANSQSRTFKGKILGEQNQTRSPQGNELEMESSQLLWRWPLGGGGPR